MPKIDKYESEVLSAFEKGKLKSVGSKAELAKFRAAARVTAAKGRGFDTQAPFGNVTAVQESVRAKGVPPRG